MNAHVIAIQTLPPAEAESVAIILRSVADALAHSAANSTCRPTVKRQLENAIEQLIDVSDFLTDDCDLEPDSDAEDGHDAELVSRTRGGQGA